MDMLEHKPWDQSGDNSLPVINPRYEDSTSHVLDRITRVLHRLWTMEETSR